MKIAVYGNDIFQGYKVDSFWNLSKKEFKLHKDITPSLVNNLLYKLNRNLEKNEKNNMENIVEILFNNSDNSLNEFSEIKLVLQNTDGKILKSTILIKGKDGLWEV